MTTFLFVHLNSKPPIYLMMNILSVQRNFPKNKVVLIHNQPKLKWRLKGIGRHSYSGSEASREIEEILEHPKEFRGNFWFTSIARFDAIREYIASSGESVLHIESDVLISKDFPIHKFDTLDLSIAYPIVAADRGVASTLYLRDHQAARLLVETSRECVIKNGDTSDMQILAFHESKLHDQVFQLAFAPADKEFFHTHNPHPNLKKLECSISHFQGLFDGNDIGVYLFGTDPRNKRGNSILRSEIPNNYAAPKKWNFVFDQNRKFLNLKIDSGLVPIYSVHATCKQILLFWHFTRAVSLRRQTRRQSKSSRTVFYPRVFCQMGATWLLRRNRI